MVKLKILAFDSTAKVASVAISDGEKVLAHYNIDNGLTQSELLLPMADELLRALKLGYPEIDAVACSVGPGSFTGVRIGVSLVKGIAFSKNIPCVEISTLEALAENAAGLSGIVVPCMDARRGQFYTAIFESTQYGITRLSEDEALSAAELAKKLTEYKDRIIYIVGDGYSIAHKLLEGYGATLAATPEALIYQSAASIAKLAARKLARGEVISDRDISPTYLRVPQAERERLERLNSTNN